MIEFDADTHTYKLDGMIVPSVTQVLAPLNDFTRVDPDVLKRAQDFGTAVHLATELFDRDDLDEDSLDEALRPYLSAWKKFHADTQFEISEIEHRVASRSYRYAGTIDRVGFIGNLLSIVDIKTGTAFPASVGPQTAAYESAFKECANIPRNKRIRRLCVQLKGDGTYKSKPLDNALDLPAFMACLTVHNWRSSK